jgi:DNA-directed RNA polymerase specialized sigma24 family protein
MCAQTTDGRSPDSEVGSPDGAFPATHWSQFAALRSGVGAERTAVLNFLIQRYWKPVYCYLRRSGCGEEEAKDLVQDFFVFCLQRDFFDQADPARGRFRSFLLGSLQHFLANARRAAHAQKRRPEQGFVPLRDPGTASSVGFEPADRTTPEGVFHHAWVADLIQRVLGRLEKECQATDKQAHYEILRLRLVLPALEGAEPPPLRDLAQRLGLSEKQAANCLLTARRAFQRLLQEEIRGYARNEDEVAAEVCDLFRFLGES